MSRRGSQVIATISNDSAKAGARSSNNGDDQNGIEREKQKHADDTEENAEGPFVLMFKIAPRSGYAQGRYSREVKTLSMRVVREEVNRRTKQIMAAFKAGEITLQEIIAKVHACDAYYGFDPLPPFDALSKAGSSIKSR